MIPEERVEAAMSAVGCLCGREDPPRVGDPMEIGDVLGFMIEPEMRWGRVVGFIREDVPLESVSAARVIVREFRAGDGRWPSGGYRRAWLCVPWEHEHPVGLLSEAVEPPDWSTGFLR